MVLDNIPETVMVPVYYVEVEVEVIKIEHVLRIIPYGYALSI